MSKPRFQAVLLKIRHTQIGKEKHLFSFCPAKPEDVVPVIRPKFLNNWKLDCFKKFEIGTQKDALL